MNEFKRGAYVNAFYKGSRFTGKIGNVDNKHGEAEVVFAPGVSMLLPQADINLITEQEYLDGTDTE
jgi:hypothetical protein